jgi:hypothetical protein
MVYGHLGVAGSEFRLMFLTICQAKELPVCYGKSRGFPEIGGNDRARAISPGLFSMKRESRPMSGFV